MKLHTHKACYFCGKPKIIRSKPHETRSGKPICPDCLGEWDKCFKEPLTEINYLPNLTFDKSLGEVK
jgi:transposase-like protein